MQGQIKMDQIMECKHAADWDGMNVKDFLKKYLWTQGGFGVFYLLFNFIYSGCKINDSK